MRISRWNTPASIKPRLSAQRIFPTHRDHVYTINQINKSTSNIWTIQQHMNNEKNTTNIVCPIPGARRSKFSQWWSVGCFTCPINLPEGSKGYGCFYFVCVRELYSELFLLNGTIWGVTFGTGRGGTNSYTQNCTVQRFCACRGHKQIRNHNINYRTKDAFIVIRGWQNCSRVTQFDGLLDFKGDRRLLQPAYIACCCAPVCRLSCLCFCCMCSFSWLCYIMCVC